MAKQIYVEKKTNLHASIRKIGKDPDTIEDKKVKFLSIHKGTLLFKADNYMIQFQNHIYETSNKSDIDFIRKHPMYKQEIYENEFPDWYIKKVKEDQRYVERSEEAFTPAEA